ncbi:MAG: glycosyltransferase family 4 protein [Anaerolineales bacterium]|nr:glycosyltransferase family 4 protein [Anaerolineales bacterium]
MGTNNLRVGLLHYSAPPIVGGVESVMSAHSNLLVKAGYSVEIITGIGDKKLFSEDVLVNQILLLDTNHPEIIQISNKLETGIIPENFEKIRNKIKHELTPILQNIDVLFVHNIFTKHFNLPLTAALFDLLDDQIIHRCIAWSHDFTWTSPNSCFKVHDGYPWDLLKTSRPDIQHVVVSRHRQTELARLYQIQEEKIKVIYNGVDIQTLLGLSPLSMSISNKAGFFGSQINLLLPVRVTQAKNMEFAMHVLEHILSKGVTARMLVTGPPDPHDPTNRVYFQSLLDLREKLGINEAFSFVYQLGERPDTPLTIGMDVVGELFRISDALIMPSHREGFGMPILEAGLSGLEIFSSHIPAADEIGQKLIHMIDIKENPEATAEQFLNWAGNSDTLQMKAKVRNHFTWDAIFQKDILPLLERKNE